MCHWCHEEQETLYHAFQDCRSKGLELLREVISARRVVEGKTFRCACACVEGSERADVLKGCYFSSTSYDLSVR